MIPLLLTPLADEFILFNLARYTTFRAGAACMTALLIALVFGNRIIGWLRSFQRGGQPIREDGPESHLLTKMGTPTMGGVLILLSLTLSVLLWADLRNGFVWAVLFVTLGYGALGFADDWLKVTKRNTKGVSGRQKLVAQAGIAFVAALWFMWLLPDALSSNLAVPFFKETLIPLGILFPFVAGFVMMGSSNAVNLTDGLDGLAIMPVVMVGSALGVFAYVTGSAVYSKYLLFPHIPGSGELLVFCAAMAGAGLAFLWFNTHPAQVFMGDVGALALGAALGTVAVIVRQEIVLAIMGGIFVVEAVSVMLQVVYFKYSRKRYGEGRRLFRMAPLHHHFEKSGWRETQVVVRFWIITMLLCMVGLSTLKLR